jgi:outer membrane protein OmpA-like peptidoglycan-associated protein
MSRFAKRAKYSIFTLGFLLLSSAYTHAQLRLIYNENFVSNKESWPIADETTHALKLVEGHYELKILNTGSRWVYAYPSINPKTYFIIEIKVKIKPEVADYAFGVIWNVEQDGKNLFKWSRNGNLHAEKMSANIATNMGDAKTTVKFDDDAYHVVKVKSFSNRCEFYIDDALVHKTTDKMPYKYGNGVGVYVSSTGTANVDYIRVYQEREPINLIETDFKVTDKQNLGSAVNTHYSEVQPVISHDGKTLFFTRKAYPKNVGSYNDDVWYSNRDANNTFSQSQNLGKPVNNTDYNSVAGFSADGKKMVAFGKYTAAGANAGDGFCEFTKTESGWGNPKNLNIKNYYNLNEHCESSYSPDGSVLILTIERRDSYGGKDIYVSLKQADGTWSAPFNGGAQINSYADEISPFLAGDNKTLYFASEGHSGYGSSDVFMTRRLDDTWKNWSKPVNMGPVINSHEWDAYFTIDAKGDWAYMVSNNHSIGKTDIFKFKIPHELKPDSVAAQKVLEQVVKNETVLVKADSTLAKDSTDIKVHTENVLLCTDTVKENSLTHAKFEARVYGKAYDAKTKQVLPVPIVIRDLETHKEVYTSSGETEGYDAKLEEGSNYDIYANYTGYIVEHANVDLTTIKGNFEKQVDLYLTKVEKDETIVMNNIFFEQGSSKLRYDSRGALMHVANLLKENPTMKILIGGHTQMNTEEPKFNMKLSQDRAKEVFQELIKLGAARKQMTYKGFGNSKPLYDTNSAWENAKNGRVDFTILTL